MIYPFNEPISVRYKLKPRVLSFLNRIPYKDSFLLFLKRRLSNLNRLIDEEVTISSRIIEHPLVFGNLGEARRILDVGCCESKLSIELASLGYDVYGVDFNEYPLSHPNFHFVKADITNLPFHDDFFDCITSISTIEHIGHGIYNDPICGKGDKKAASEMIRVLKPNGHMLISVPYGEKPWPKSSYWYNKCSWYNNESLEETLKGLRVEKREYFIKKGDSWVPAIEVETKYVDPSRCIVFLKLRRKE